MSVDVLPVTITKLQPALTFISTIIMLPIVSFNTKYLVKPNKVFVFISRFMF